jgi:hypothetical protein
MFTPVAVVASLVELLYLKDTSAPSTKFAYVDVAAPF